MVDLTSRSTLKAAGLLEQMKRHIDTPHAGEADQEEAGGAKKTTRTFPETSPGSLGMATSLATAQDSTSLR